MSEIDFDFFGRRRRPRYGPTYVLSDKAAEEYGKYSIIGLVIVVAVIGGLMLVAMLTNKKPEDENKVEH